MKIVFASRYVDPFLVGGNKNVYLQAKSLKDDFEIDIEILTWPANEHWSGPMPKDTAIVPALKVNREGLVYHVFTAPTDWDAVAGGNVISNADWQAAVDYGMELLRRLQPDIVHLQHRHGLWWLLESAQRLGIHTVYSNHDWGLACLRTILVMGDGSLCNGMVAPNKCAQCVKKGRGFVGMMNEALVESSAGEVLVELFDRTPFREILRKRGIVRQSALKRATTNLDRATRVVSQLSHCFTPSQFGKQFFSQLGVKSERITVLPWYHNPIDINKTVTADQPFTITYIGRVSPEKGVHLIFDALENVKNVEPLQLRIAGANDTVYCSALRTKYPQRVGIHDVIWLGWSAVEPLYTSTDVTIIPSILIDNTPLSLIEAFAYRVPVIATRVPPIEELITDGANGFLAEYMSVDSLSDAIRRAIAKKVDIRSGTIKFPPIMTLRNYMAHVVGKYREIVQAGGYGKN